VADLLFAIILAQSPSFVVTTFANSRAVFAKTTGVSHGQKHEVLGRKLPKTTAEAISFTESRCPVWTTWVRNQKSRYWMP
jgi:hypothetical protein